MVNAAQQRVCGDEQKHFIVSVDTLNPTQIWRARTNTHSNERNTMNCWSPNTTLLWTCSVYSSDLPETPGVQVKDKMERERRTVIIAHTGHLLSAWGSVLSAWPLWEECTVVISILQVMAETWSETWPFPGALGHGVKIEVSGVRQNLVKKKVTLPLSVCSPWASHFSFWIKCPHLENVD